MVTWMRAALVAAMFLLWAAPARAGLEVGRMKVTLMPEYDARAVLVILEGKFADKSAFPSEARFLLPPGVTKLTDVCSLSPGGQHFCQLFELKPEQGHTALDVRLPYSDFFIDFQYAPFTPGAGEERSFTFPVKSVYPIHTLEIHVQEPQRARRFTLSPGTSEVYEKDGFRYHKIEYGHAPADAVKGVTVTYTKDDAEPSVDITYSSMQQAGLFEGRSGEALVAVGLAALAGVWFARRRARPRR